MLYAPSRASCMMCFTVLGAACTTPYGMSETCPERKRLRMLQNVAHKEYPTFIAEVFNSAFRNLGAAPSQGPGAEGACPLVLCSLLRYLLVNS